MEELIKGLIEKVGLDEATAKKVFAFLAEHADDLPGWLAKSDAAKSVLGAIGGGGGLGALGGLFGGGDDK